MINPQRIMHMKKLSRIIEISKAELLDIDLYNDEEKKMQSLIVSQQERLLEMMQKNNNVN